MSRYAYSDRFNVGDRVICNTDKYRYLTRGSIYTVADVTQGNQGQLVIFKETGSVTYRANEFILAKHSRRVMLCIGETGYFQYFLDVSDDTTVEEMIDIIDSEIGIEEYLFDGVDITVLEISSTRTYKALESNKFRFIEQS